MKKNVELKNLSTCLLMKARNPSGYHIQLLNPLQKISIERLVVVDSELFTWYAIWFFISSPMEYAFLMDIMQIINIRVNSCINMC